MAQLVREANLADRIVLDSAGTGAWHAGEPADSRARAAAARRGVTLTSIARQVRREDFARFDYLIAMDGNNLGELKRLAPPDATARLHLLREFDPASPAGAAVPDPYYGGDDGFGHVLDICEAACRGLLDHLRREHRL